MSNAFRIISLIAVTSLLAACGLFGDKEEELEPMELVKIDPTLKIKKIWSAKLGGDAVYGRTARYVSPGDTRALRRSK